MSTTDDRDWPVRRESVADEVYSAVTMYFDSQRTVSAAWGTKPATAREVKAIHANLERAHAATAPGLGGFYGTYFEDVREKVAEDKANHRPPGRDQLMFYPIDVMSKDAPRLLCAVISAQLRFAVTYQVTAPMCDMVTKTARSEHQRFANHVRSSDLPSPFGFAWLDKPRSAGHVRSFEVPVRAVSWSPQPVMWTDGQQVDGTRICEWAWARDNKVIARAAELEDATEYIVLDEIFKGLGDMILLHTYVWPHAMRFDSGAMAEQESMDDDPRSESLEHPLAWLRSLWMLLGAEISVTHRWTPHGKNAQRRAQRSPLKHSGVQVVTLRRARHADASEEHGHRDVDADASEEHGHRDVEWTCRWPVGGHWRHLVAQDHHAEPSGFGPVQGRRPLCKHCGTEITWIAPYVGNASRTDLPYRVLEKVHRLSR